MALEWINSVSSEGKDKFSGTKILLLHSPSPDLAKCALGEDTELSSLCPLMGRLESALDRPGSQQSTR